MADLLFLDPNKHPYLVLSPKGNLVGRFSNLACAAQSVVVKARKAVRRYVVLTPDGTVVEFDECLKIVQSWGRVKEYVKRAPTGMVA